MPQFPVFQFTTFLHVSSLFASTRSYFHQVINLNPLTSFLTKHMLLTEHIFSWCKMEQKLKWNFSFKTYTPCIKRRRIAGLVIQKK